MVVLDRESPLDRLWTSFLCKCMFPGKQLLLEHRKWEMTAGGGTWDLSSHLGCAAVWLLLFHLHLFLPKKDALFYRRNAEIR